MEKIKSINGYLNVYKEAGMTSHDVVFKTRKILKNKKIGHTGTLDPEAEGVLVLCIGQATKMVEYITNHEKEYVAEIILGKETDTCDCSGKVINDSSKKITKDIFQAELENFKGSITQIPPIYSAIRVNGKKLYHYARNGETVEIPEREVFVSKISLLDFDEQKQKASIMVTCSKGTYIRSLCRDIGKSLGSLGCMGHLVRHRVGDFSIEKSLKLADIQKYFTEAAFESKIYPLDYPLHHFRRITATEQGKKFMRNGNKLFQWNVVENFNNFEPDEPLCLYDHESFVGIGTFVHTLDGNHIKPVKLL
jgi:tRNA pseudouridine55 synthase